jgi:hypothetical protein
MALVSWMRAELRNRLAAYRMIRDVLEGAQAIKGRVKVGTTYISGVNGFENIGSRNMQEASRYLPKPNPLDTSPENAMRYRMFVERAQWFGATAATVEGMIGQVFERDPEVTLPDNLAMLESNIDGGGVTLKQQMRKALGYNLPYGRGGLLADFPATNGVVTQEDVNQGKAQPVFRLYAPWNIINWRIQLQGSKRVLTLLVLIDDDCMDNSDRFEAKPVTQYRVLYIDNADNTSYGELWREKAGSTKSNPQFEMTQIYQPTDQNGKPLTTIPFIFIGSQTNDEVPDKPPVEDMADVNVGHYRNSAEYEDAIHMLGQPTPYASGLTENWVKQVWGGKTIAMGSRAVIPLPANAEMGLLQVEPNTLAHEGMIEKQNQLVMLGARLIAPQSGNPLTATGESYSDASETSVLSNCADNVSAAYKQAFIFASAYVGAQLPDDTDAVSVKLHTSFQTTRMTAPERQELVSEWQKGAISWTEMRVGLRGAGVAVNDDKTAKAEIEKEQADAIATGIIASPVGVSLPPTAGALPPTAGALPPTAGALPPTVPGQAPNPQPALPGPKKVPAGKGAAK